MKKTADWFRLLFFIIIFGLMLNPSANAQEKKNIFLLHSYYPGLKWTVDIHSGILAGLEDTDTQANIYNVFMEVRRLYNSGWQELRDYYRARYGSIPFDLIMVSDNDAFEFMRRYGDEIFPGVPVVFTGVYQFHDEWLKDYPHYTGVVETVDLERTMVVAMGNHPEAREIVVFVNKDHTGVLYSRAAGLAARYFSERVNVRVIEDASMEQALLLMDSLPANSVILLMNVFHDTSGRDIDLSQSTRRLSARRAFPVYSPWDFFLGTGVVGGVMTSGLDQGKEAGRMAGQILAGTPVSAVPVLRVSPTQPMFDYEQLARFHISEDLLPPGNVILNKPMTAKQAEREIWMRAGLLVFVLLGFICLLLVNIYRRVKAEAGLRHLNEQLEDRVTARTVELAESNIQLQNQTEELTAVQEELRAQTEELIWTSQKLQDELAQRRQAEQNLRNAHEDLELRISLRTQELAAAHQKLAIAYDATIEGWAKALELRDIESAGHSRRVADGTLRLAAALGVDVADLVHYRRGALLHDIGKMSIPDSILLKPGPLTDEEWVIMKKHPQYAKALLSSVTFLQPAIDIPYYHHEKWDGTGYPDQLAGENIPLAARIFAIIDVWDALSSDRPYRPAWSEERINQHIRQLSGSHFDPRVVEAFNTISWDK